MISGSAFRNGFLSDAGEHCMRYSSQYCMRYSSQYANGWRKRQRTKNVSQFYGLCLQDNEMFTIFSVPFPTLSGEKRTQIEWITENPAGEIVGPFIRKFEIKKSDKNWKRPLDQHRNRDNIIWSAQISFVLKMVTGPFFIYTTAVN